MSTEFTKRMGKYANKFNPTEFNEEEFAAYVAQNALQIAIDRCCVQADRLEGMQRMIMAMGIGILVNLQKELCGEEKV